MKLIGPYHLITNQHLVGINCIYKVVMVDQLPIWIVVLLKGHAILVKETVTQIVTADRAYCAELTTVLGTFQYSLDSTGRSRRIVVMVNVESLLNFKFEGVK